MAGTILINDKVGIAMSGVQFDHLVEAIRPYLREKSSTLVDEVYNPLDEGGMDFIFVESLNADEFKLFCDATSSAFDAEVKANPRTEFQNVWNEVLRNLTSDPRHMTRQET
jgi:hypothetical protein